MNFVVQLVVGDIIQQQFLVLLLVMRFIVGKYSII